MKKYILLLLIIVLVLSGCAKKEADNQNANTAKEQGSNRRGPGQGRGGRNTNFIYSVAAITMNTQKISEVITLSGVIQAKNSVSITPDTGGSISRILAYEGKKVKKNEVLAYVDPSMAGQSFLPNPVKTPIAGIVSSLPVNVGNRVAAQQVIATVADNSEIEMKIQVPEKYVGKVNQNTKGQLFVLAYPDETFEMKVKTLSEVLSDVTHTMPVTMSFVKQDNRLKSGMYASINLVLTEKNSALVVPRDAIMVRFVDGINKVGVYVIDDQEGDVEKVKFVDVELGIEQNNKIEIVSGLKPDDVVIIQGQEALSSDSMIRIFNLDGKVLISPEDEIERIKSQNESNTDNSNSRPNNGAGRSNP